MPENELENTSKNTLKFTGNILLGTSSAPQDPFWSLTPNKKTALKAVISIIIVGGGIQI